MGRKIVGDRFHSFGVHSRRSRYGFEVTFVRKVEEEDVIGLTINVFSYCVRLIGYEGGEDSEVPHPRNDVIPIGFPQIKMSLFSKEKNGSYLPLTQKVQKLSESVLNNNLAINRRNIPQIQDQSSAFSGSFKKLFEGCCFCDIVCEKAGVQQAIVS